VVFGTDQGAVCSADAVAQPTGGPRGTGSPPKPHHKIFTDYKKYETCPVNRKVKSITGFVFVFVSREAAILALNTRNCFAAPPGPAGGAHSAAPDSLAEFRGGERWHRKTAGQREGERVRKEEEDGREEKDGGGKKESKGKSGCASPETKSWLCHCADG